MRQAQRSYRLTDLIDVRPGLIAEGKTGQALVSSSELGRDQGIAYYRGRWMFGSGCVVWSRRRGVDASLLLEAFELAVHPLRAGLQLRR
jgi:hypothetical protein